MLGDFLRTRKRKAMLRGGLPWKRRHNESRSTTIAKESPKEEPSLQEEVGMVTVDGYAREFMKIETEGLLINQNPCTVYALATALVNCKQMYMGMTEQSDDGSYAIRSPFDTNSKSAQNLKVVLRKLQTEASSQEERVSSWQEAEKVLSRVVRFKDETLERKEKSSLDVFARRLKDVGRKYASMTLGFMKKIESRRLDLLQVASSKNVLSTLEKSDEQAMAAFEREQEEKIKQAEEAERTFGADKADKDEEARELVSSLLRPLTDEEQEIVNEAIYGIGPTQEIMAQVGTDSVQRGSLHRLQPGQWLNDEVLHYFLVMLSVRDAEMCQQDPSRRRCHFFKSFFMTKLLNEGNANPELDGKYEYRNVKRWSKKAPGKDLFNLDKIIFPINEGNAHWVCAVAFMQEKRIQMYDPMGSKAGYYLEAIFKYLLDEHKDKKKEEMPDSHEWVLVPTTDETPRQKNEHIAQCRERIALSIMSGRAIL